MRILGGDEVLRGRQCKVLCCGLILSSDGFGILPPNADASGKSYQCKLMYQGGLSWSFLTNPNLRVDQQAALFCEGTAFQRDEGTAPP